MSEKKMLVHHLAIHVKMNTEYENKGWKTSLKNEFSIYPLCENDAAERRYGAGSENWLFFNNNA